MRRILAVGLAVFALLGVLTPDAFAQAPTPTFRINGLFDQLGTYASNVSNVDADLHRRDTTFYGRTRGRWDIIGEYGKTKAVLGLEADLVYGQTGATNTNIGTVGGAGAGASGATFVGFGTDGSAGLNTDVRGILEIKWLYTEFEAPMVPVPTVVRLGLQPYGAAGNYKLAVYANGDFAGVNVTSTISPNVKAMATYVAIEEAMSGRQCGNNASFTCVGVDRLQLRGDDWAVILSTEVTPVKGLDIKPMYSYLTASGTTSAGQVRTSRGGINATTWFTNQQGAAAPNDNGSWRKGLNEDRHTVGIDARFRAGGFSFDPTVLYQFGNISRLAPGAPGLPTTAPGFADAGVVGGRKYTSDIDAWLIDLRAGYQLGPLLIEGMYMYTTGNSARNTTLGTTRYFQPLSSDTGYMADWGGQLMALGIDYLQALGEAGGALAYPGAHIGYDKYGRHVISPRVTYAWTPTFTNWGGVALHLTDTAVQADATPGANGLVPVFNCAGGSRCTNGTSHYIGTEMFAGVTWKFAPGVTWDNAGGYMFTGGAFDAATNPATGPRDAKDAYILTSRVRFTF